MFTQVKHSITMKQHLIGLSFLCTLLLSSTAELRAQIIVDESLTAQEVVETILLGEGVEIFNVTYSGDLDQIGSFDANNSNILIPEGMIMATGSCSNVIGPNDSGSSTTGGGNLQVNDPDLDQLSTFNTNDAAVLEFDFIPTGDSINFNYSFGSDEYNEYVCGSVNDAFGFFLSGPGINGAYSNNAINLAVIPNTNGTPVTINSVNNGNVGSAGSTNNCAQVDPNWMNNTAYYVDNENNGDANATQLDGFTVVLVAEAAVQCGQTYHIKIAIADAGDTAFDSAVFIEGGSFSSNAFDITATASISGNQIFGGDTTVVESCNDAVFQVVRPFADIADTLDVTISGTATNGVDYETIDPEVIMEVGEFSYELPLIVIPDAEVEGPETVTIEYMYVNLCGDSVLRSATLIIADFEPTQLQYENPVGICNGEAILEVETIGGYGPFDFLWSTGDTDTLAVNVIETDEPGAAQITVTDVCGNEQTATITYTMPPELVIYGEQTDSPLCPGDATVLEAGISTGVGPFTYDWSSGGDGTTETVNFDASQIVTLTVTDACGIQDSFDVEVEYPVWDPITGNDPEVCLGIQGDLNLTGGVGEADFAGNWVGQYEFYTWQYSNYDASGNPQDSAFVLVDDALDSLATFIGPSGNFQAGLTQGDMDIYVIDQCGAEGTFNVSVIACDTEIPNVFSPNGDSMNDFFRIPGIEGFPNSKLEIYNRWGNVIYQSNDYGGGWDGRINNEPVADGTYYYILRRSDGENFHGGLTITRQRR
jgi:gliding motility-associated-like protein